MSTFDEKLKDYFEKLGNHPEIVTGMKNYNNNSPRMMEMIFAPTSEVELLAADAVITYFIDVLDMVENSSNYEIPEYSDIKLIGYYVSLINAYKKGDSREIERVKQELNETTPEEQGEMLCDAMLALVDDPYEYIDYIQEQTEIDDAFVFKTYYDMADNALKGFGSNINNLEEALSSSEEIDKISRLMGSFDSKYHHVVSGKKGKPYTFSYKDQQQIDPCRNKDKQDIKM